jgi:hypothetical protein
MEIRAIDLNSPEGAALFTLLTGHAPGPRPITKPSTKQTILTALNKVQDESFTGVELLYHAVKVMETAPEGELEDLNIDTSRLRQALGHLFDAQELLIQAIKVEGVEMQEMKNEALAALASIRRTARV